MQLILYTRGFPSANTPYVSDAVTLRLEELRAKDKEAEEQTNTSHNGSQNNTAWSDEDQARPRTPDEDWHEDSPTQTKSEPIKSEAKAAGNVEICSKHQRKSIERASLLDK